MSFNEDELRKIKNKTSGFFKGKARYAISRTISSYKSKIDAANSLTEAEREQALAALLNQATEARKTALKGGANSYGDPAWAAAATVESWLHALIGGDPQSIEKVETLIEELHARA